jgi:hypothetical protein
MKLEYIATGSAYAPLMRLYDFTIDEVTRLYAGMERLASGEQAEANLQTFVPAESVGNSRLTFVTAETSRGIEPLDQTGAFACVMSLEGWADMAEFIKPFCSDSHTHPQWLTGYESYIEIPLLISTDGRW